MKQLARPQPVALIVRHKQPVLQIDPKAVRRAKSRCERGHISIRRNLQHPAAVRRGRVHPPGRPLVAFGFEPFAIQSVVPEFTAQFRANTRSIRREVQTDIKIPLRIACRAKGELVIISGHPEAVVNRLIAIRHAVAVFINNASQLRSLHHDHLSVTDRADTQRLLQPIRKQLPLTGFRLVGVDLAPVKTGNQPAIGHGIQSTHLRIKPLRHGNVFNRVIVNDPRRPEPNNKHQPNDCQKSF